MYNFSKLKDFLDRLTSWRIPGNTVIVTKGGNELFRYSSGYADLENKTAMNGNELVNIYSVSKVITVTAAMQLYEKGIFLLNDPLYDFIPEFRDVCVKNENGDIVPAKSPITLKHLFTMSAGLNYDIASPAIAEAKRLTNGKFNTLQTIKCLAKESLSFEPGKMWQYSLCHDVLAGVVEAISGKKFSQYVKENIFDPLEMKDSFYHNESVRDRMAEQYIFKNSDNTDVVSLQAFGSERIGGTIENVGKSVSFVFGSEYDSGGAGVTCTVGDLSKFSTALACGGRALNRERILSPATIDLIRTSQLERSRLQNFNWSQLAGYEYGLGVRVMTDKALGGSNGSVGEFGWGGAAGASLHIDPDLELSLSYAHHMLNAQEDYYQPRLRNILYSCI